MISPRTRRTRLALAGERDDGGTAARAFADSGDAPGTLPCCPCGHGTFGVLLPSYGCDATALLRSDALDRCPSAAVDLFPEVRSLRTGRSTLRCRPRECVARVGEDFLGALRGGGGETYSAPFAFLSLSYIHLEFGRAQSFFSDRGTSEKTLAPPHSRKNPHPTPWHSHNSFFFFFFLGKGGDERGGQSPGRHLGGSGTVRLCSSSYLTSGYSTLEFVHFSGYQDQKVRHPKNFCVKPPPVIGRGLASCVCLRRHGRPLTLFRAAVAASRTVRKFFGTP